MVLMTPKKLVQSTAFFTWPLHILDLTKRLIEKYSSELNKTNLSCMMRFAKLYIPLKLLGHCPTNSSEIHLSFFI